MHFFFLFLALLFGFTAAVRAEEGLGMVTGPPVGTYIRMGHDIAAVAQQEGITVTVKESRGSIANIKRITSRENAALGIVQSDVLGFLKRSQNPDSIRIADNLRMIFPLYDEEVHVLAQRELGSFQALHDKVVIVGPEGSGSWLTAMNLFAMTGVKPSEIRRMDEVQAVIEVLNRRADAMIFVGGKPVRLFRNLERIADMKMESGERVGDVLHLLPLTDIAMREEYQESMILPEDYSFVTEPVPTIAVTSVLVAYDFEESSPGYAAQRCHEIRAISQGIRKHLPVLKEYGHLKWQQVEPGRAVGIWKTSPCAEPGGPSAPAPAAHIESELLRAIRSHHNALP